MKIKTKYKIGDVIKFRPFGDPTMGLLPVVIENITIKVSAHKTYVEYDAIDKDGTVWCVAETSVVETK